MLGQRRIQNTNRRVHDVVNYGAQGASRELAEGRVS